MSSFPSCKAKKVFAALLRIGWREQPGSRIAGSHRKLVHADWPTYTWAFHDSEELGPVMLRRIAKHTGLRPEDL